MLSGDPKFRNRSKVGVNEGIILWLISGRYQLGLLELSRQLGSVTQACKVFGYSRDSFYRFKKLYEEGGELALRDIVRLNSPNPKNWVDPEIESRVVKMDNPDLGQQSVSNELHDTNIPRFPVSCKRENAAV